MSEQGESTKKSSKKLWAKILALILVSVFILNIYVSSRTEIQYPRTYEEFDQYAVNAVNEKNYDEALEYLDGCIENCDGKDETIAGLELRKGSVYILKEEYDQAFEHIDKAIELDPDLANAWYLRAELYRDMGQNEKSMADFKVYQGLADADPVIVSTLASDFENAGDDETAISCYTKAIDSPETFTEHLYVDRARCEARSGDLKRARKDLEKYFTLTEEDPRGEASSILGMCLMDDGEYDKAVSMFRQAIDKGYPDTVLIEEQIIQCLYAGEDYEGACSEGEKVLKEAGASAETAEISFWTGISYMAQGLYEEAFGHLQEAEKDEHAHQGIRYYLGVCAMAKEDYETAIGYFTKAITEDDNTTASLYNRAVCYIQTGRAEEAAADLKAVIEMGDDPELSGEAQEILEAMGITIFGIKASDIQTIPLTE
ncbi:MAG: tetratricopeptide repeat protein [Lachnospiraceae bacterium]|nr:tetratricopeptide repeat protein [Lachnospiraceae bacterium]